MCEMNKTIVRIPITINFFHNLFHIEQLLKLFLKSLLNLFKLGENFYILFIQNVKQLM